MERKQILVAFLIISTAFATSKSEAASSVCEGFFKSTTPSTTTDVAIRAQRDGVKVIGESGTQLILALKKQFVESHASEPIIKLMKLGVSQVEVAALVTPALAKDLEVVEGVVGKGQLPFVKTKFSTSVVRADVQKAMTLEEFSTTHHLSSARLAAHEILTFRETLAAPWGIKISDLLRTSLIVGDPALIERAQTAAFRFNHHQELIGIAAAARDDAMLMQLGEINLARFLFFERNANWLSVALGAFVEVRGPLKIRAQEILFDLADIMASPEIVARSEAVAMMGEESASSYYRTALDVLMSTLELSRREDRDSATFDYVMVPSTNANYVGRVKSIVAKILSSSDSVDAKMVVTALALTGDTKLQLDFASRFFKSLSDIPKGLDERGQAYFKNSRLQTSFGLAMTSKDGAAVTDFLNALAKDPMTDKQTRPFFSSGTVNYYFSKASVDKLRTEGPAILNAVPNGNTQLVNRLSDFLEKYDYALSRQSSVKPESKILFEPTFAHEASSATSLIAEGRSMSSVEIDQMNAIATRELNGGELWSSYRRFAATRNLAGLQAVYNAMMTSGRGLDAVYVATAMIAIEGASGTANRPLLLEATGLGTKPGTKSLER